MIKIVLTIDVSTIFCAGESYSKYKKMRLDSTNFLTLFAYKKYMQKA